MNLRQEDLQRYQIERRRRLISIVTLEKESGSIYQSLSFGLDLDLGPTMLGMSVGIYPKKTPIRDVFRL